MLVGAALALGLAGAAAGQSDSGSRFSAVPAEMPPPGFEGVQYVDSRGCAYIRAGMGAQVTWVPRVDRDRNPVCGLPPSLGGVTSTAATATPRRTAATPRRAPVASGELATSPRPPDASAPQHVAITSPRQPITWLPPADGEAVAHRLSRPEGETCPGLDPVAQAWMRAPDRAALRCGPQARHPADDGPISASAAPAPAAAPSAPQPAAQPAAGTAGFVQVAAFAVPENATATAARFRAMDLPVRTLRHRGPRGELRLVRLGPMPDAGALRAALEAARSAGFADAYVTR